MRGRLFILLVPLLLSALSSEGLEIKAEFPGKADGIFQKGEPIICSFRLEEKGRIVPGCSLRVRIFRNGNCVKTRIVSSDTPGRIQWLEPEPAWLRFEIVLAEKKNDEGKAGTTPEKRPDIHTGIGCLVAPGEMKQATPEPEDFDRFWEHQKQVFASFPMKVSRRPFPIRKDLVKRFRTYDVSIACPDGIPATGVVSIPRNAAGKSLPILVNYMYFGVYSCSAWTGNAIRITVNANGLPNGEPESFYREKARELGFYPRKNSDNRETYYMKNMYLRALRIIEYAANLPEWDGKRIIVQGHSQGGGQALAAAALDPRVTACFVTCMAMGDHDGAFAGRPAGWPGLYRLINGKPDQPAVFETAKYFDNVNFAKRIRCEAWIGIGLNDTVVPPTSSMVVYNTLKGRKHLETQTGGGHGCRTPRADARLQELLEKY